MNRRTPAHHPQILTRVHPDAGASRTRPGSACAQTGLIAVLLIGLVGCSSSGEYPSRPITLVCPWSVGGGTDRVSRQMAIYLEQELGVPVNVINATGGRGVTGHSRSLNARPDGYTIGTITFELNTLHWQDLTGMTWQDAEPLMSVNEDAAAVWIRSDAPWESLEDLVTRIREEPGTLTASGTANGGAWHLALAGWLQSLGLAPDAVRWIPMGGASPSLQELVSGGLDLVCCSLPEARELYRGGTVRALGVMSEERVPGFEQIPTMREQGMDWVLVGWRGFAVPLGTPTERVELLTRTMHRIVNGDVSINGRTFPDFMSQQGFNNRSRNPAAFRDFLRANDESLGKLITSEEFRELGRSHWGVMTWPTILAAIAAALLFGIVRERPGTEPTSEHPTYGSGLLNAAVALVAIVFYLASAETLGFIISAGLLLVAVLVKLGTRPLQAAAITVVFVPCLYMLFAHLLRVPLPRGLIDL